MNVEGSGNILWIHRSCKDMNSTCAGLRSILDSIISPQGTLRTAYQPIVNHARKHVLAYEALSRPQVHGTMMHPLAWFRTAYQAGLAVDADILALISAVAHLSTFPTDVVRTPVFVNVMPYTLTQRAFVDKLACLAEASVCDPSQLVLEIVEYTPYDLSTLVAAARELRSLGVRIAIDDVQELTCGVADLVDAVEPDYLKIDRTAVQGAVGSATKRAALSKLVREFEGRTVLIAEGVETVDDLWTIQDVGLEISQGYLWGHPSLNGKLVQLQAQLEIERWALLELVRQKGGTLTDPDVIQKSREVDFLILRYYLDTMG